MESEEKLKELKKEYEALRKEITKLTEEELKFVTGGKLMYNLYCAIRKDPKKTICDAYPLPHNIIRDCGCLECPKYPPNIDPSKYPPDVDSFGR